MYTYDIKVRMDVELAQNVLMTSSGSETTEQAAMKTACDLKKSLTQLYSLPGTIGRGAKHHCLWLHQPPE